MQRNSLRSFLPFGAGNDHYGQRPFDKPSSPYGHLLNFFLSDTNDTWNDQSKVKSNFYRLLDFVHVPSRFSGTDKFLDPTIFRGDSSGFYPFFAPFNLVSNYREPGRVNINTIFDDGLIWRGIMNGLDVKDPRWAGGKMWQRIADSRTGDGTMASINVSTGQFPVVQYGVARLNNDSPTLMANPFRSFGNSHLVPIEALRRKDATATGATLEFVDGTLLRRDIDDPKRPLFAFDPPNNNPVNPQFESDLFMDSGRNPYFRYQAFRKLGNLLTTRSNVYAVWVTVGFFEVEQVPVDEGHPDGFRLGAELGADTGDVKRHRLFSIIDRTRPVGFQRGKDINVDGAILLKRIIE